MFCGPILGGPKLDGPNPGGPMFGAVGRFGDGIFGIEREGNPGLTIREPPVDGSWLLRPLSRLGDADWNGDVGAALLRVDGANVLLGPRTVRPLGVVCTASSSSGIDRTIIHPTIPTNKKVPGIPAPSIPVTNRPRMKKPIANSKLPMRPTIPPPAGPAWRNLTNSNPKNGRIIPMNPKIIR